MDIEKELETYSEKLIESGFSVKTQGNYMWQIMAFLSHFKDKESPSDITLKEVEQWVGSWSNTSTQLCKLTAVRSFCKLTETKIVDLEKYERPRRNLKTTTHIDKAFLLQKIDNMDNRKHKAFIALAFSTGMRLGEIINLELTDIDFEKNKITATRTDNNKKRVITLSDELSTILKRYIFKFAPVQYLFNGDMSPQYSKTSAICVLKKHVGKEYNFHMLRSSTVVALLESGASLKDVQKQLGVSQIKPLKQYEKITKKIKVKDVLPI